MSGNKSEIELHIGNNKKIFFHVAAYDVLAAITRYDNIYCNK